MKNCMLILMVVVLASCGVSNSPEKVVETFYSNMFSGKTNENVGLILNAKGEPVAPVKQEDQADTIEELNGLTKMVTEVLKQKYNLEKIEYQGIKLIDTKYNEAKTQAKVTFILKIKGAEAEEEEIVVRKIEDKWMISIFG
ncbi:hypothetical protein [Mangrovibacterium marinum]|uniref:DUF4878 domain-containing protein n=1 Tax=Mangrovibacterium marinum TaxID=1639118 RepID=A0A2T5C2Z7_9BACT|nr:hypothetical protein [Mangrovibacterium marinum]PTN09072.1 hypothetical protein C8N47_106172 [Mangrovibacterium marinum]